MRHLHKGFLPSACYLPVPGHMVNVFPVTIWSYMCNYLLLMGSLFHWIGDSLEMRLFVPMLLQKLLDTLTAQ